MCNVTPKKVDVSCSCTKCDSVFCLAKENDAKSCSCEDCSGSKSCLFYSSVGVYGSHSDATNARSPSRTLPGVVSNVARYIASSVVGLVSPQTINSTCCATSTATNDTGTNTIDLYRKLNSPNSKCKMEQIKKTYLTHKKKVNAPVLACNTDICQPDQQDFIHKKTVPSDRTTEIYRTEILKQKLTAEALKPIYVPTSSSDKKPEEQNCTFDKCSKYMLEKLKGYSINLNKKGQVEQIPQATQPIKEPIKPAKTDFEFTHILDSNWNTIEIPGNQYASQNCECIVCVENKKTKDETLVLMNEPPGYILDLPRIKLPKKYFPHSKSCSCEGEKSKSPKKQEQKCASMSKSPQGCTCDNPKPSEAEQYECMKCTESTNVKLETAGYVIDLPINKVPIKESCADKLKKECFPKSTFCSYNCEEQKPLHKVEQNKPKMESKGTSQSQFYSENTEIQNTQELFQVNLEPQLEQVHKDVGKKEGCEFNVPKKMKYESSGYVLELKQYKPTKNAQELVKDVLVTQGNVVNELPNMDMFRIKECECKIKPKSKCELSGCPVPNNAPKQICTDVIPKPKYDDVVCCDKCGSCKNKNEMPEYEMTPEKKKCECSESKLDSSSTTCELPRLVHCMNPEPQDVCGCSEFEKNKRAYTENNSNMNIDCKCRATAKCKSSGYVFELPKYIPCPSARKDSCGCKGLDKNRAGSYGNVFDLPKPSQKRCKCPESTKNMFDVNRIEMSSNITNKNNEKCVCKGTAKCKQSSIPGYVVDLPKSKTECCECPKKLKPIVEKKCDCDDASKNVTNNNQELCPSQDLEKLASKCKVKRPGYILDLPTTTPAKYDCDCREANKQPICMPSPETPKKSCDCPEPEEKIDLSKYIYVIPKPKPQTNCCKCPQTEQNKPTPETKKSSCGCREAKKVDQPKCTPKPERRCECPDTENKVDLTKYVYVLPELPRTPKTKCECPEIKPKATCGCPRETVVCKSKPKSQIDTCKCPISKTPELAMDSSGFVLDLKASSKKGCVCNPSEQNRSELAGYVLELPPCKTTAHKPDKCECTTRKKSISKASQVYRIQTTVMTPETQNICNNMLGKQSDTHELLKHFYTPCSTPMRRTDLCKNILKTQTEAIEILKKVYLPQKESPINSDEPDKNQNLPSDDKTKVACPKECQMTEAEADGAANLLSTAMLSAEVMNMPYTELNDSLGPKQSDMEKPTKLSKYDILKRIEEAYKACSCKVCECIAGKDKTEPCECNECQSYRNQTETKKSNIGMDINSKYQCQSCTTNTRFGSEHGTINHQMCDCKPCNCVDCERSMAKLCACEPCQCLQCKTRSIHQRQTLVVAPVGREENVQRVACSCSPCDCIECGLVHPLPSNVMHEVSTGTNRHALCRCEICLNELCDRGVDSCSCQRRNKVMSKPVEKSTHDFDIRTATTNNNKLLYSRRRRKSSTHNTIAMYAAVPTNYHALTSNDDVSSNDQMCNCDECECLNCVCQEETWKVMNTKSSQLFSSYRTITKSDLNVPSKSILNSYEDCKSLRSCSCQLCKRQYDYSHTSASYFTDDCECKPCECVNCGKHIISDRYPSYMTCQSIKENPNPGNKYKKEMLGIAKPLIKKGEVLTPSTHTFKVQNQALQKENSNALSVSVKEVTSNKSSRQKSPITSICHKLTNESPRLSKQSSGMSPSIKIGSITNANIGDIKKTHIINKNNSIDNEISSYLSGYSSFNTSPIASGHRKSGGCTSPMSRNKYKSWESSCNSSGHDYPEYLIQFPQSTLDTGLNDVMELNSNQTKSSDKSNLSPKRYSNYNIDKLSHDDVSTRENTNTFNFERTSNKQNEFKKSQQRQKYYDSNNNCDEMSSFRDLPEHADELAISSQFYKLEMKNKSNYHKNKNIKHITDKDNLRDPRYLTDSRYSLKNDGKKKNDFNLNNKFNDFHRTRKVFDSNIVQKKTASAVLPVPREGHNLWHPKCVPHPFLINNTDIINAADLKRVRKTLKEAKEFSLELMRLLIMYENANKEFESISDKLQLSHACLVSGDFEVRRDKNGDKKDIIKAKQDQEKCSNLIKDELHGKHSVPPSGEINTDLQTTISNKNVSNLKIVRGEDNLSQDITRTRKLNLLEEIESNLNRDEQLCKDMAKQETNEQNKTAENTATKEDIINVSFNQTEEIPAENNKAIRKKEQTNKKNIKKNKMSKRKVTITKRINVRNSNEMKPKSYHIKHRVTVGTSTTVLSDNTTKRANEPNTNLSVKFSEKDDKQKHNAQEHCNDLKPIMKKIESIFAGIRHIPISTSTETNELSNRTDNYAPNNTGINHEVRERTPWPILRKNFSWSAGPRSKYNEMVNFPSLDLEIKQRVQSISQQTATIRKRRHENKALASLHVEVQKLLNMPILQSQQANQHPKENLNKQHKKFFQTIITESKVEEMPESSRRSEVDKGVGGSNAGKMKSEFEETPESLSSSWSMVDEEVCCCVENNVIKSENKERPELVDRGNKMEPESKESLVNTFMLESCA
ncbi:uncharacterized protein LOC126912950 isoform X4 [Spodoptera frugiperda]|uniref:Uncharacterized protein LOC126912950 isoform X4 n=1 Tax=Spodoptera frugiperda TaxID=7108 RepID=A0A9R0EEN4_SPOFR|nr:uncharacterized protein LOC126912950 isoform X4 [Spodoptera frugiperda]